MSISISISVHIYTYLGAAGRCRWLQVGGWECQVYVTCLFVCMCMFIYTQYIYIYICMILADGLDKFSHPIMCDHQHNENVSFGFEVRSPSTYACLLLNLLVIFWAWCAPMPRGLPPVSISKLQCFSIQASCGNRYLAGGDIPVHIRSIFDSTSQHFPFSHFKHLKSIHICIMSR